MLTPNLEHWAIVMMVDGDTIALGPRAGNIVFSGKSVRYLVADKVNEEILRSGMYR